MTRREALPPRPSDPPRVRRVEVETDRGVFMISVAAELASMHPQTLRVYEARGLVEPKRSPKGTRLYSQQDVERLRRIHEMTVELGLNLAGVQRVLDLESEVRRMHTRIEELEVEALQTQVKLAEELEEVRRSFRAELVPYRGGKEIVRAADARSPFRMIPVRQANLPGRNDR
ncbi:MAG TPA: MerR family transcriptional regulator [Solirubrobacteraceae bacterium]|nr:MerR family transcriptional regulator [Solirubrobacteraceae bacterium]